jgi:hypothetical protein
MKGGAGKGRLLTVNKLPLTIAENCGIRFHTLAFVCRCIWCKTIEKLGKNPSKLSWRGVVGKDGGG